MLLTRDYDGHYISLAPGEKTKCLFYADDRTFGWIYSGQMKITIDGQEPFTATKGFMFDVPGRLSYCFENTGTEPVVFYRNTPAGQVPSYYESETPNPIKGYRYEKDLSRSTGGYEGVTSPIWTSTPMPRPAARAATSPLTVTPRPTSSAPRALMRCRRTKAGAISTRIWWRPGWWSKASSRC